ncbi:MAG: zinc-binding dehydrogenase [Deltaproteobacteria bacterium]|nr:zinc-binding dehydrogenase [Deltaproteobacteria bacterium]
MKKVVIHTAGGYDRLRFETHPDLTPGPGEVRVAVAYAGVNFADCVVRLGLYQSAKDFVGWPITPGFEISGVVDAVGEGVKSPVVGDEVVAVTRFDGYASQVVVSTDSVFPIPEPLTLAEAAAFPAVHLTGWYALSMLAHPRKGEDMLVHSAAGGVGSVLTQLGKIHGCRVVGVVGQSHKVPHVEALGADAVIDKSRQNLFRRAEAEAQDGYGVILDANGVATLKASYDHLAPGGRLVVYGFHTMFSRNRGKTSLPKLAWGWLRTPRFDPLSMTNDNKSVLAFNLSYLFERNDILTEAWADLSGWLAEGRLARPVVKVYPAADVAETHRALESAGTVGKLVLAF